MKRFELSEEDREREISKEKHIRFNIWHFDINDAIHPKNEKKLESLSLSRSNIVTAFLSSRFSNARGELHVVLTHQINFAGLRL